jgi:hypothetical protein
VFEIRGQRDVEAWVLLNQRATGPLEGEAQTACFRVLEDYKRNNSVKVIYNKHVNDKIQAFLAGTLRAKCFKNTYRFD